MAPEVRPGFLSAVSELVGDTIAARTGGVQAERKLKGRQIAYVYGRNLYDLTLTDVGAMTSPAAGAGDGSPVHAEFGIRSRTTGKRYTFELEYATNGPLAGVPTLIRHQPRWWVQVVLRLEEPDHAAVRGR